MRTPLAFVLAVGDELVTGRRADGNGVRIGRWLEGLGCRVLARCLVPDDPALIAAALKTALDGGAEVVAVAGGLGPSVDDVTRDGIAAGLGLPLELNPGLLKAVEARYRDFGREMAESAGRQALLPQGAEPIANPMGTAPGFFVDLGRVVVAALPGVPREMEAMLDREVLPRLRARLAGAAVLRTTVLRVAGLPEAEVDRRVRSAGIEPGTAQVTLLPRYGEVEVLVTLRAENDEEADEALPRALRELERQLGDHVYGRDADTLVGAVRDLLAPRRWTLAVAETITGGLLAKNIVDLPGAGRFFVGSLVPYADALKPLILGVPPDLLDRCGPVSAEAARAMAHGVRARLGADVALATTGIAGPAGGTADKPVGLAYIAVVFGDQTLVRRHLFAGDRATVRHMATTMALEQTRRALAGLAPLGDPTDDAGL